MGLSSHYILNFFCMATTKGACERAAKEHIYKDGPSYKVEDTFINCSKKERLDLLKKLKEELNIIRAAIHRYENEVAHPKSHCYCFTDHLTPTQNLALHVKYATTAENLLEILTKKSSQTYQPASLRN